MLLSTRPAMLSGADFSEVTAVDVTGTSKAPGF